MSQVDVLTDEQTVDVLKQAYLGAVFPNPFEGEGREKAERAYARLDKIEFDDYWSDTFRDFRDKYNGNPAGFFAQEIFMAAEKLEGENLKRAVAEQLAGFGRLVLEAGLNVPDLPEVDEQKLSGLAQFLNAKRAELEGAAIKIGAQHRKISDDWVKFAAQLAETDPDLHQTILAETIRIWTKEEATANAKIKAGGGRMEGYGTFDKKHALSTALAAVFARHFPEIVIGKLKEVKWSGF